MQTYIEIILLGYIFCLIFTREFCLLCAHGRVGQTQHFFSWRRISQSEIRNSAAEKSESESEGGQKFLPPNLPFCPPRASGFVPAARSASISQDFVQKRFERRSVIATNQNLTIFQDEKFARSPRKIRQVSSGRNY
jgi:hypothetical protein